MLGADLGFTLRTRIDLNLRKDLASAAVAPPVSFLPSHVFESVTSLIRVLLHGLWCDKAPCKDIILLDPYLTVLLVCALDLNTYLNAFHILTPEITLIIK